MMSDDTGITWTPSGPHPTRPPRRRRRIGPLFAMVFVGALAAIIGVGLIWHQANQRGKAQQCAFIVHGRVDNRAMWVYVVANADPANPRVAPFVAELNRRLPELTCDADNNPIPATSAPITSTPSATTPFATTPSTPPVTTSR